jgi:serine/threonine protein kinase
VFDSDTLDNTRCVAKILNSPRDDRKARFLREIEVTETFDHPNVVRSLGKGETRKSKFPHFVMPYYELGTLESNYKRLGALMNGFFLGSATESPMRTERA